MQARQADKKAAKRYAKPRLAKAGKLADVTAGPISTVTGRRRIT